MKLNSKTELYAYGNYAQRKIEGGFYYRSPNTRSGIFKGPEDDNGNPTILVANFDQAQGDCPVVHANDAAEYSNVNLPDHCFIFNEKFPGGFTPRFGGTVRDWSGAVGIRGDISSDNVWLDDWHYDLSAVFGYHSTAYFMENTINPQLAALRTNIPTNYNPGADIERDRVFNLDLARSIQTAMLPSPLNIGLGLEYRIEEYEIEAGGQNSWFVDGTYGLADQGFSIGSNGFPGRPPRIAGPSNRGSYAGYVDLETNVTKDLLVGVAGRYEDFETFGDTLNGKFNTRWQATPMMALRGSVSTGFRAPTVGQANIINVTTVASGDGDLEDQFIFPANTLSQAEMPGARQLDPEKSFNLSAGTVLDVGNLNVTIDYYRIAVRDRISLTNDVSVPQDVRDRLAALGFQNADSIAKVRFFTNTFDTTTNGVDIVATYPMQFAGGNTLWTFAGNFNQTLVENRADPTIIDDERVVQLEQTLPTMRFTLTGDHRQGPWRFLGRVYWYNSFTEYTTDDPPGDRVDAGQQWLVDFETSYTMKTGLTISAGAQNLFDSYPDRTTGWRVRGIPSIRPLASTVDTIT